MTYYLVVDNATQWFSWIIATEGDMVREAIDLYPLNSHKVPFLSSIYEREMHFPSRTFMSYEGCYWQSGSFYGWSITPTEFARIRTMVELERRVKEFSKLAGVA